MGSSEATTLLRGEVEPIARWARDCTPRRLALYIFVIVMGTGFYGAAIGFWRSPLQSVYTALKFPIVILLTTACNALLNGMVAPLLGLNLRFRETMVVILMSFTIAACILAAAAPLLFFLVWNVPEFGSPAQTIGVYSFMLLAQVVIVAFAGVVANLRLLQLLTKLAGNRKTAWSVFLAWVTGNLFLGAQLVWVLRPFVGSPGLPVEFLRQNALNGNFYEAVIAALNNL
jgi:hypothetical protein